MLPTDFIKKIKISENVKRAFIYTIIVGIFCHFFILSNKLINHDDLEQLVSNMDYSSSGRWFLQYANLPSSQFSMPWVNGFFIILYTAIISSILMKLFEIKNKIYVFLLSSILIVFPTNVAIFHYSNSADAYMLGALLGIIGVYLLIKYKYAFPITILLTILSLATYQSYFGLFFSISIIYYLILLLNETIDYKSYIKNIIKITLVYLSSILLYIISVKYIFKIELLDYQNINNMGSIDINELPNQILVAFSKFFTFFIGDDYFQFSLIKYLNVIFIVSVIYLFYKLAKKHDIYTKILAYLSILILPLSMNLIFIMAPNSAIGLRMLSGYLALYVFSFTLLENIEYKNMMLIKSKLVRLCFWAINLIVLISLYKFYITTNKVYTALELDKSNVLSYTTRVVSNIENQPFYEKDKNVYFVGSPDITTDFTPKYTTPDVLKSTLLEQKIPANYQWRYYPERYTAFPNHVETIWKTHFDDIKDTNLIKKLKSMPIYPKEGSIAEYNNEIYVKFKEY